MSGLKKIYDFHTHHNLKQSKRVYLNKGLSGLVNLGNTCYFNSALQCLSNTLKLTDFYVSDCLGEDDPEKRYKRRAEWPFVGSFQTLIVNIWDKNQLLKPVTMHERLTHLVPKFKNYEQQDSHECLMFILDLLHKGTRYDIDVTIKGVVKNDIDKLYQECLNQWKTFYETNYSHIVDIFHGQFFSRIQCRNSACDFERHVFDPFCSISVSLPATSSKCDLIDCIRKSLETDIVKEWACEKCTKKGCSKSTKFWSLPNYIIIHLKRFTNTNQKIQTAVDFPIDELDMTPFMASEKYNKNNYIYSLYAVNFHSGTTNGGHYWAACKNLNDEWYNFNDGNVTKIPSTSRQSIINNNAYILFYYRKFVA